MENKLIIVRGISGSGKTTFAREYKNKGFKHYEADMYFYKNGIYNFDINKVKEAHEWCQRKTKEALENGYSAIVSNTFTRIWEMQPYLDIAKELGVTIEVFRMENRFKNIHNVPQDVVNEMEKRFEDFAGEKIIKNNFYPNYI